MPMPQALSSPFAQNASSLPQPVPTDNAQIPTPPPMPQQPERAPAQVAPQAAPQQDPMATATPAPQDPMAGLQQDPMAGISLDQAGMVVPPKTQLQHMEDAWNTFKGISKEDVVKSINDKSGFPMPPASGQLEQFGKLGGPEMVGAAIVAGITRTAGALAAPATGGWSMAGAQMVSGAAMTSGAMVARQVWDSGRRVIDLFANKSADAPLSEQHGAFQTIMQGIQETTKPLAHSVHELAFGAVLAPAISSVVDPLMNYAVAKFSSATGVSSEDFSRAFSANKELQETADPIRAQVLVGMEASQAQSVIAQDNATFLNNVAHGRFGTTAQTQYNQVLFDGSQKVMEKVQNIASEIAPAIKTQTDAAGNVSVANLQPHELVGNALEKVAGDLNAVRETIKRNYGGRSVEGSVPAEELLNNVELVLKQNNYLDANGNFSRKRATTSGEVKILNWYKDLKETLGNYKAGISAEDSANAVQLSSRLGEDVSAFQTPSPTSATPMPNGSAQINPLNPYGATQSELAGPSNYQGRAGNPIGVLSFDQLDATRMAIQKIAHATDPSVGLPAGALQLSKLTTGAANKAIATSIGQFAPQEAARLLERNARYASIVDDATEVNRLVTTAINKQGAVDLLIRPGNTMHTQMVMGLLGPNEQSGLQRAFIENIAQKAENMSVRGTADLGAMARNLVEYPPKQLDAVMGGEGKGKELIGLFRYAQALNNAPRVMSVEQSNGLAGKVAKLGIEVTAGLPHAAARTAYATVMDTIGRAMNMNKSLADAIKSRDYDSIANARAAFQGTAASRVAQTKATTPVLMGAILGMQGDQNGR